MNVTPPLDRSLSELASRSEATGAWSVSQEEAITVLSNAYKSGHPTADRRADQVRDRLLAFGYLNFREIRKSTPVSS